MLGSKMRPVPTDAASADTSTPVVLTRAAIDELFEALTRDGFRVIGPRVRGGAVVHEDISTTDDLPVGLGETQEAGTYRLVPRGDDALFGYSVASQSFKQHLFAPRVQLVKLRKKSGSFEVDPPPSPGPKLAFVGARACDIAAIAVQDRTLLHGPSPDPDYAARRADVFVVAVQCGQAGGTCFCVSMGTGPKATSGFDVALTELFDPHRFLAEAGTERGARALAAIQTASASAADREAAEATVEATARSMGRALDATDVREVLFENLEHPRWDEVATRCLSCTNCTLVCPTCFCSTVEDTTDLAGETAERWRRWDSCFTLDHSYLHGGSVRATTRSRYRQWLTHKLASWIDQFGTSGCVGCGRCVTWCPVGIDIPEEVRAIRGASTPDGGGDST
jgi:ferredoxin